nr:uncharacterized protein LOC112003576 [Quercus suber]
MQREIDDLKRKLRHAQQGWSEPSLDLPSDDESDDEYRQRSRTPPSETFSHEKERYQRRKRDSPTPRGLESDAMSKTLDRLSKSPFTRRIKEFNQRIAVHSKNEALMCKVFPSSLGSVAMRWFNGLRTNSIDSYRQLTQAFGSRFVTNSKPPWPMSTLLSLSMHDGKTLKAYSDKYWEVYNDLDGKYDDIAINTFKNRLPMGHNLRKSLTGKPATSVRWLMDQIDKYKRVEEDMLQSKGEEKVILQERRNFRLDRYNNAYPRRDFDGQFGATNTQAVVAVFREPDHGHTTEDCRNLWNHLDQLVREGKLKHLLHHSSSQQGQTYQEPRRDAAMGQPVGTSNVILAAPRRAGTRPLWVLSVAQQPAEESQAEPKRARRSFPPALSFSEEDKVGTTQPHDDALVVTLKIGGYDVKRVMVDGGNVAKVMYPDLYKGLGLKPKDLTPYSSPLMSFDGKLVIPKGMIRLPIQIFQKWWR